ncbi:cyclic GMP-AMP synthase-like receptor 1 [Ptychodera flava]|uniref:cyclic GMP-AMP synthase-like receptor 1 n=1 Tax=Ptychodera flava TaxID=63121 RepID=UPI00396A24A9
MATGQQLNVLLNKFTEVKIQTSRLESRKAIPLCLDNVIHPILKTIGEEQPRFRAEPPLATSSYFEGLRVSSLNNFELLVSFVQLLSFRGIDDVGTKEPGYGSHGYIIAKHSNFDIADLVETLPKNVVSEGFTGLGLLSAIKVKRAFFAAVDGAMKKLNIVPDKQITVRLEESHDSIPILKVEAGGKVYSIHLVPCIVFRGTTDWPPSAADWGNSSNEWLTETEVKNVKGFGFHMLPKQCHASQDTNLWRFSFSCGEKYLLRYSDIDSPNGRRKQCERILKTIREANRQDFKPIASYHIKTIFLNECTKFPKPDSWSKEKLGERFKGLLRSMMYALEKKQCPHFFIRGCNLFDSFDAGSLNRVAAVIRDILADLSNDPAKSKYFALQ